MKHAATNEGSSCDDGEACTGADACLAGTCSGTPIPLPGEAQNFRAVDGSSFAWDAVPGATAFDVLRGSLSLLPVGPGAGDEVCFGDLDTPALADVSAPPPGTGLWYLSRGGNACGRGTYGNRSDGSPRASTTCP